MITVSPVPGKLTSQFTALLLYPQSVGNTCGFRLNQLAHYNIHSVSDKYSYFNSGQTFPNTCPVQCVSLLTYLPPVRVILVANLHNVPSLEGQSQSLAQDLIVKMTIVVEVGTHIFLCVCVCVGGGGGGGGMISRWEDLVSPH